MIRLDLGLFFLVLSVGFPVLIGFFVILLSSKKVVLLRAKSFLIIFDIFFIFSVSSRRLSSLLQTILSDQH